jgi:hypothetical protein
MVGWPDRRHGSEAMIKYQLICEDGHEFEGWFGDSAAFESQQDSGLLTCPACGSATVRRALMAPNLASPKTRKSPPAPQKTPDAPATPDAPTTPGAAALPAEAARRMHALMTEMRALQSRIKDECRDVGNDFAEEARKIHYGEVEAEGIYGNATTEEREALDEEGIAVMDIAWLPKDN